MTRISIITVCLFFSVFVSAQLRGSGQTVSKTYDYKNFDKISFEDLDGKIEVEIGKPYNISVVVDDNLEPLLTLTEETSNKELTVKFRNNKRNWRYIEGSNIVIKISLPNAIQIKNSGNCNITVNNANGSNLLIKNESNGNLDINGSVEKLEIINDSNGNIQAQNLLSKEALVTCLGNGNVTLNCSEKISAKTTSNGNINNVGLAKYDSNSSKTGNGNLNQKNKN